MKNKTKWLVGTLIAILLIGTGVFLANPDLYKGRLLLRPTPKIETPSLQIPKPLIKTDQRTIFVTEPQTDSTPLPIGVQEPLDPTQHIPPSVEPEPQIPRLEITEVETNPATNRAIIKWVADKYCPTEEKNQRYNIQWYRVDWANVFERGTSVSILDSNASEYEIFETVVSRPDIWVRMRVQCLDTKKEGPWSPEYKIIHDGQRFKITETKN